ncbi:hypothetical protein cyc_05077 [Cyclospora cayetanensis]|uniref:Uncharacterized protein n=1 Tax=Cyclospora cayetanensis TaxID=88456 RepID=A0A1D3CU51_9EIME|nr:hypothetical protein cyc_05077 [Cyclospora cayetanensis]
MMDYIRFQEPTRAIPASLTYKEKPIQKLKPADIGAVFTGSRLQTKANEKRKPQEISTPEKPQRAPQQLIYLYCGTLGIIRSCNVMQRAKEPEQPDWVQLTQAAWRAKKMHQANLKHPMQAKA